MKEWVGEATNTKTVSDLEDRAVVSDKLMKDILKMIREHEKRIHQFLDGSKRSNTRATRISKKSED